MITGPGGLVTLEKGFEGESAALGRPPRPKPRRLMSSLRAGQRTNRPVAGRDPTSLSPCPPPGPASGMQAEHEPTPFTGPPALSGAVERAPPKRRSRRMRRG